MKRYTEIKTRPWNYKYINILPLIAIALCYLIFPNNNPTTDAWEYAANVKMSEELFRPHHLLYSPFMFLITRLISMMGDFDTLKIMQITNGAFALLCLVVLRKLLLASNIGKGHILAWLIFAGSTFSFLRYGTENETYIIPIFFSLLSSLLFKYYIRSSAALLILLSGILGSLACLFHQLHIFWWIGIAMGLFFFKDYKALMIYILSGIIIPGVYILVLTLIGDGIPTPGSIFEFILSYFFSGEDAISIGGKNLILSPISLFRSFFQLHGNIVNFLLFKPLISSLSILVIIYLLVRSFILFRKSKIIRTDKGMFERSHLYILMLMLVFAFAADGNAEFMVAIPILTVIVAASALQINPEVIKYFSFAMFLWNMAFAILPNHFYDYHNNKQLVEVISVRRDSYFILAENLKVSAQYKYIYGNDLSSRIKGINDKPDTIDTDTFYTDLLSKSLPFSRASMVSEKAIVDLKFIDHLQEINSFHGIYYIDKVELLK